MTIDVNEVFFSIQGEARWTGTPSMFIRMQGCPVGCNFCDTKHTWTALDRNVVPLSEVIHKPCSSNKFARVSVKDLVSTWDGKTPHVVITGGEPFMQADASLELARAFIAAGAMVQFETSGTYAVPKLLPEGAWITLSPKFNMTGGLKVLDGIVGEVDEIKMPVETPADFELLRTWLKEVNPPKSVKVWLQPISQGVFATQICVEYALQFGYNVSIQTHKYMGVE